MHLEGERPDRHEESEDEETEDREGRCEQEHAQ